MSKLLTELNHQRFLERYDNKKPKLMAIISVFGGTRSYDENVKQAIFFAKKLKAAKFDFIKYIGDEIQIRYHYEGFVIFCEPEREKDLIRFLMYFGKYFKLNSFVLIDETNTIWDIAVHNDCYVRGHKLGYGKKLKREYKYRNKYDIDDLIKDYSEFTYQLDDYKEFKKRV